MRIRVRVRVQEEMRYSRVSGVCSCSRACFGLGLELGLVLELGSGLVSGVSVLVLARLRQPLRMLLGPLHAEARLAEVRVRVRVS